MRPLVGAPGAVPRALQRVRNLPPVQVGLRAALVSAGGGALLIAPGGRHVVPTALLIAAGVAGLGCALVRPGGGGPAVVVAAAAVGWLLRYGSATPPLGVALVLAVLLYLHHSLAALTAALPPTAAVEPALLLRWAARAGLAVAAAAGTALAAALLGALPGSGPLEYAGIGAAVLVAAIPVLLARRR